MGHEIYIKKCHDFIRSLYEDTSNRSGYENQWKELSQGNTEDTVALCLLREQLQLSELAYLMLIVSVIYEVDPRFARYCLAQNGSNMLCFGNVIVLYQKIKKLSYELLCHGMDDETMNLLYEKKVDSYLLETKLQLRKEVLYLVLTNYLKPMEGLQLYTGTDEVCAIYQKEFEQFCELLAIEKNIHLYGVSGSGRKSIVKQYVNASHIPCFFVDLHVCEYTKSILLYCLLQKSILCFENIADEEQKKEILMDGYRYHIPIVICSDSFDYKKTTIHLPNQLCDDDKQTLCDFYQIQEYNSRRYVYPVDFIRKKIYNMEPLSFVEIQNKRIAFEDLILQKDLEENLQHVLYMLQHPELYVEEASYQKCLTILLYGPSGTGKTMSAHMLAYEANLPLWKVNLAMIVDKYVGESEKHLEKLFAQAQKQNCILLFDEADVLFAKRTEISSANDRYANTSTAYLLQKMETFQGYIILTTNHLHHFDDAFLRRVQFIMRFPAPEMKMRLEKWESCFQSLIELTKNEYQILAELQDVSMAMIENVKWNAVVFWKQSKKECMTKEDIEKAIQQEYEKLQKRIPVIWKKEQKL